MRTLDTTLRMLVLGVLLSCAGACEPEAPANAGKGKPDASKPEAGGKATDSSKVTEPAKTEVVETAQPAEPTLDGCLAECEHAELSEDDRATCRVRCKSSHGGATTSRNPVIGAYLGCHEGCANKSADDRPTCHKNCAASVSAGTGDPATSDCPRGCTEAFGSCLSPCEDKNEDDAATCRKQCEVIAEKCVVGCK